MRRKGHFFRILLTAVLLLGLLPLNIWAAEGQSAGEATVLFTHDLHSCFFPRVQEGGEERGGFARLAAALAEEPRLKCIYMANQSVQACAEALRQAGLAGKVRLVAHDNSPEIRALLREGVLDFTIDQNLSYQTRKALSVLFDAVLEHKRPQKDSYYPDSPILTAENC